MPVDADVAAEGATCVMESHMYIIHTLYMQAAAVCKCGSHTYIRCRHPVNSFGFGLEASIHLVRAIYTSSGGVQMWKSYIRC